MTMDTRFAGSIPALYNESLVPVLFLPYAQDLVTRVLKLAPRSILEIAAGTGVVSRLLAESLYREQPSATIVATDLNPAMLEVAARECGWDNLSFQTADAQALPFSDHRFDLVLTQFGAMFYPDKIRAYREARRVLKPGGILLFSAWDRLEANPGSEAVHHAVRAATPEPKPDFMARTPFGYCDPVRIEDELREAGFEEIGIERIGLKSPPGSARRLSEGMCLGSPLANELAVHPKEIRDAALAAAVAAAEAVEPETGFDMSAWVITAR